MKNNLILIIIFCCAASNLRAQESLYVIVPMKIYKYNKVDIYGLSSLTNQLFAKAGYRVFTKNKMSWPADLQANPCKALYTETEDVSPLIGLTKVKLTLKDCFQRVLYETIGKDNNVDDIKALHTALKEAFETMQKEARLDELFKKMLKINLNKETIQKKEDAVTIPHLTSAKKVAVNLTFAETLKAYWKHNPPTDIEGIYEADTMQYFIRGEDKVFFLYDLSEKQLAQLVKTALGDVYKIHWDNGTEGIAFSKEGMLKIEQKNKENSNILNLKRIFPND